MTSPGELTEAHVLVDSYGTSTALVKLAQLAAPACRIEPQLLRRLRLECVPEADVSVEQELWHSEFVNSRGTTITFRAAVARVLRDGLRIWREREPVVVENARNVMRSLHAGLSPLLVLEDELAWAEVFDDRASIRGGAKKLLSSLLARREGLDHWLGRAWTGLPADLKTLPEGRQLAQVAAAEGATIAEDGPPAADQVAHALPLVELPISLHGMQLDVNVPPPEATHVLDVPRTQPRAVSVAWPTGTKDLTFGAADIRGVHVSPGTVIIRTLAGAEYEIQVLPQSTVFEIEMLAAGHGTVLIVRYGSGADVRRIVVDCGDRKLGKLVTEQIRRTMANEPIELLVLTHSDDDRIGGAGALLEEADVRDSVRDVWLNGRRHADVDRHADVER